MFTGEVTLTKIWSALNKGRPKDHQEVGSTMGCGWLKGTNNKNYNKL